MKVNWKRAILVYLIGFIIARASFYRMNPLAAGFFSAAYLNRSGGLILFASLFAGILSTAPLGTIMTYFITLLISSVIMEMPQIKNRNIPDNIRLLIAPAVLAVFLFIETAAGGWKLEAVALSSAEVIIAYISGAIFKEGIGFITKSKKGSKPGNEQMVSLALIAGVIIYAMPDINNMYVAPVETLIYFCLLFFSYKYGIGQGAVAGAVSGFAMSLRTGTASHIGILSMMGIIPAMFRRMGRIPCAAAFIASASFVAALVDKSTLTMREISAVTCASVVFLLLPANFVYRAQETDAGNDMLAIQNIKRIADARLKVFSDTFIKLSKTMEEITQKQSRQRQKEISNIFEEISEKLCRSCKNCAYCWENNFQETYNAAAHIFEVAEEKGYIEKEDIPEAFLYNCICAERFIQETNRGFELAKVNRIWSSRMEESRRVIADQLREVSLSIREITGSITGFAHAALKEEQVRRKLKAGHIRVKELAVIEREDRRMEVYINAASSGRRCITSREAAALIGEALGIRMRASESSKSVLSVEYENFVFIEETKFKILTGVARAIKGNESGDNFSILKLETGLAMLGLSDGMGTGKEAGDESETVLSLLEQMMEAGFRTETAINLINSGLMLKGEAQTFSTVDLGLIDLYTGICEFIKIGAAASFIKRDNWVETISSTTLPIGMLGRVDYDSVKKKLYEGDIVILITDGVLDCIKEDNKEACMEQLILSIQSSNPQEIANRILDGVLAMGNYEATDDMSVITAGIWLK
jgi:stage II sporulation protein E